MKIKTNMRKNIIYLRDTITQGMILADSITPAMQQKSQATKLRLEEFNRRATIAQNLIGDILEEMALQDCKE